MLNLRQFVDFLNLLKTGKVYNGKGNKLSSTKIREIYNEITKVKSTWRAEWLDADFKLENNNDLYMNFNHKTINGKLEPQNSEKLTNYLAKDKNPGIDLEYWLKNANDLGLPTPNTPKGDLYYYQPEKDNNSVARFGAYSCWACLGCDWDPRSSGSSVGVRPIKIKK